MCIHGVLQTSVKPEQTSRRFELAIKPGLFRRVALIKDPSNLERLARLIEEQGELVVPPLNRSSWNFLRNV